MNFFRRLAHLSKLTICIHVLNANILLPSKTVTIVQMKLIHCNILLYPTKLRWQMFRLS